MYPEKYESKRMLCRVTTDGTSQSLGLNFQKTNKCNLFREKSEDVWELKCVSFCDKYLY